MDRRAKLRLYGATATVVLAVLASTAGTALNRPSATAAGAEQEILTCDTVGSGGDRADLRGIRFTVDRPFVAVEVRMEGGSVGNYSFTALLRRSTGFTSPVEAVVDIDVDLLGNLRTTPYPVVRIDFPEAIAVTGPETFTLKFAAVSGPDDLFFEAAGIGSFPCPDVQETEESNVANPTVRSDPTGFRVWGSPEGLAGNVDCRGKVNAVDAALVLQLDARLLTSLRCQQNADTNRDGCINAIDALRILHLVAGLIDTLEPPVVTIGSLSLGVDQQGSVDVGVLNVIPPGLCCWQIDVVYDPEVLSVVECQVLLTTVSADVCIPDFEENAVGVIGATPVGLLSDLALAMITFRCTVAGTSPLTLDVEVLADATVGNPQAIAAEIRNGAISCT